MNPMAAAQAYAAVQNGVQSTSPASVDPTGGADFSSMLQGVMTNMTQTTRAAETQMAQTVQGQGSLIDVVTAISSAEASLETVMAVRDQVIQAYQEIMRMPI